MEKPKNHKKRTVMLFVILGVLLLVSILFYIYTRTFMVAQRANVPLPMELFIRWVRREVPVILGIVLASVAIGFVTLNFQTLTGTKILTPAMLGFPAMFNAIQLFIIVTLGTTHFFFLNRTANFFLSSGIMIVVSVLMFGTLLKKNSGNMIMLLLFGMVFSGIISSITSWVVVNLDLEIFEHFRTATEVTLTNINTSVIPFVIPIIGGIVVYMLYKSKTYDAISLGESNAKNLGVNYSKEFKISLLLVAVGMAVSTALIGSIAFLGLLVVNISRELFRTYKHKTLFIASSLIAMIALIFGQAVSEVFRNIIPVTIVINLVGCIYVFYLIIKENRKI